MCREQKSLRKQSGNENARGEFNPFAKGVAVEN
jgi:hypothetical protein